MDRELIDAETIGLKAGYEKAFTATSSTLKDGVPAGRYYIWATEDCWIKRGAEGATVTAAKAIATEFFLPKNTAWPVIVHSGDVGSFNNFSVIRDSADGIVRLQPVH